MKMIEPKLPIQPADLPIQIYPWKDLQDMSASNYGSEEKPDLAVSSKENNQFRHQPGTLQQVLPQIHEKFDFINKNNNQPRHTPKDPHPLPPNPEKSDCEDAEIDKPKQIKIRVLRGENLPETKDKYYVYMRGEEWHDSIRVQSTKIKTKPIRGSQPVWKENFTIKTRNPERWMLTIKLKKSSALDSNTSITVGSGVIYVSNLFAYQVNRVKLYDNKYYPVGKRCVDLEIRIEYPLPEVIPRPKIIFEPKGTPAEVPPSGEHKQEKDEKKPNPESPTNEDAEMGETEAEAFQKVALEEAQLLPQQSTDGSKAPTERNCQSDLLVNPSPAPNQTLLDILDMMLSSF
ncbi:hypothetical protein DAPPUDRAFT_108767 [Daphnia pulex]|uniref:C2 domain-containing protein n=1 Tax=Daphnia pulex TaxID=6669 RepID=E9H143_DAPPU|nr:hypothetical protein DAPPUDRAFT_108767 [Daphnia pulex]|eukprot:EFX74566.1 hypothetical protein DAPPUDRAFT_108767 [Daphnia pulex]